MKKILTSLTTIIVAGITLSACSSSGKTGPGTTPTTIPEALHIVLTNDAQNLSQDLTTYQAGADDYPNVTAAQVTSVTGTKLTSPDILYAYQYSPTGPIFCLVNPNDKDWVKTDMSTGVTTNATPGKPTCGITS